MISNILKHLNMKKISAIFYCILFALLFTACVEKEKINTADTPPEIREAVEKVFASSEKLTQMQLQAIQDDLIDTSEIKAITEQFALLAIMNNFNKENYAENKYFVALSKEYKEQLDSLGKLTIKMKDVSGYNELWASIQKKALEIKDIKTLPEEEAAIEPQDTTITESQEETI